jgi:hypothetical protein
MDACSLDFHAAALDELYTLLYGMDSMHSQRPASLYQFMVEALNNSGGTIALQDYVWMSLTDIITDFHQVASSFE